MNTPSVTGFRLSPQQRRLCLLQQNCAPDLGRAEVSIFGNLDVACLRTAAQRVVDCYEILRTTFPQKAGSAMPVQSVVDNCPVAWHEIDVSTCGEADRIRLVNAGWDIYRPYKPEQDSPLLLMLIRFSPTHFNLHISLPTLCADRFGIPALILKLRDAYAAEVTGEPWSDDPLQYADLAEWQNEQLVSTEEDAEAGREYWTAAYKRFGSDAAVCHTSPAQAPTENGIVSAPLHSFAIDSARVTSFCRQVDVAETAFLLSVWQTLLWRHNAHQDYAVGVEFDGRHYDDLHGAIGLFARSLPVAGRIDPDATLAALAATTERTIREHSRRQEYSTWEQAELGSAAQGVPYLAHGFAYAEYPQLPPVGEVRFTLVSAHAHIDRFHLLLSVHNTREGLNAQLHFDPAHCSQQEVQRIAQQFATLLDDALDNPGKPVHQLDILPQNQRRQLLTDFNANDFHCKPLSVEQLFARHAHTNPDAIALHVQGHTLTYRQLNQQANQLAHFIRQKGIQPDAPVALLLNRSEHSIIAILAVLKAGAAYLPLDPAYPHERLKFMLKDSKAPLLITHSDLLKGFEGTEGFEGIEGFEGFEGETLCLDTHSETLAALSEADLPPRATLDNLAYVIYTSGSTGKPKGVMIEHGGLTHYVQALLKRLDLTQPARFASVSTLAADLGNTVVFGALCSGGSLHLIPAETAMDAQALGEYMQRHGIDCLKIVPSHLNALLHADPSASVLPRQRLVLGGEVCSWSLVQKVLSLCGECVVFNHYGPTETTVGVLTHRVSAEEASSSGGSVPLGRALGSTRVVVLDAHGQLTPIGVVGELYIGGPQVGRGYLGGAQLTSERFVSNPFEAGSGGLLYRTGDLVRWLESGELAFVGRVDDQVKVRGYRVELGEIESVLRGHGGVVEACVLALGSGSGDRRLVGCVVSRKRHGLDGLESGALEVYLLGRLPEWMVPVEWLWLDSLPLTANGKVDRQGLAGLAESSDRGSGGGYVGPSSAVEEVLCGIWSELLGVERVGVHDNFFVLGGHSLLATQLIFRVRSAFQVDLPIKVLFELPTVAALAERISDTATPHIDRPLIVPALREPRIPASFAQQRICFIDQFEPDSPLYNIPMALEINGSLDCAAIESSLNEVVRRHESLRTVFDMSEGAALQRVLAFAPFTIPRLDLTALQDGEREQAVRKEIDEEATRPFALREGPLYRIRLVRVEPARHVLLLTLHHTLSDGWSRRVLMTELGQLYNAYCEGRPSPLPELPIQYADYALWQRQWLTGDILQQQVDFWKQQLHGIPALLELPTDRPRPAVQSFQGARTGSRIDNELTHEIKQLGHAAGATLFMTLIAAFQTLLHRYTAQEQIVVGTPIANRRQPELEGLIGFFMNMLPLRGDLAGDPTFRELLTRVRTTALAAYAHQDLPFEKLVEELQPQRSLSHSPIFQVMFTLQSMEDADLVPRMNGLEIRSLAGERITAKFDLLMGVVEHNGKLQVDLEYNTDLFDAERMQRLLGQFHTLLEGIVANPDLPISRLPILTHQEQQILTRCNDTASPYPELCLPQLVEQQVRANPNAIALRAEGQTLTYCDLNAQANQLAHFIRAKGIQPDTLVAICLDRSPELIVALLGVLKAGGAYLPLDPAYPRERLQFMLADSGAPLLLTHSELLGGVGSYAGETLCLDTQREQLATLGTEDLPPRAGLNHLAYVIYTSGSTGKPKGVMIEHRSVVNLLAFMGHELQLGASDALPSLASFAFDMSIPELYLPLVSGGRLLLMPRETTMAGGDLLRALTEAGATLVHATPTTWEMLLEAGDDQLPPWKKVCGAEALSSSLAARLLNAGSHLYNFYGPTETTVWSTCHQVQAGSEAPVLGRPVANTRVYVLDAQEQLVPIGVAGELYIGGTGVARGYFRQEDLTRDRFIPDPFSSEAGARLYRTGDRVRWGSDGTLEFLGRADHQVKLRGFRIELGEIEAVLHEQAGVSNAVVLVREDHVGDRRLVAYVEGSGSVASVEGELRRRVKERLPDYMQPSSYVWLETFPLTANGKLDRSALAAMGAVETSSPRSYLAPRTSVEEIIAEIWADVLGVERVSVDDNFFEIGGHSLLATRVIVRIPRKLGAEVPLRKLFENPTVAGLAAAVEEAIRAREREERAELDQLLMELENLSDEEVEARLAHGLPKESSFERF